MLGEYCVNMKHLVTSGCSFSDNMGKRWPHYLAEAKNLKLYNRGQGSCGNEWISDSAIYQTQLLLTESIPTEDIMVVVCWSGVDRKSHFVSKDERPDFELLKTTSGCHNPVSFIENPPNIQQFATDSGWLVGGYNCNFENDHINLFKREYFQRYYSEEESLIISLKHWLALQWFCETHNIMLFNFTYKNIFNYGKYTFHDRYPNTKYYFDMLNMKTWWFYNIYDGMYEWANENKLEFDEDKFHPSTETHKQFVREVLLEVIP